MPRLKMSAASGAALALNRYDKYEGPASRKLGRFVQADLIGYDGGGMNLHGYVAADPINLIDPSGLQTQADGSGCVNGIDEATGNPCGEVVVQGQPKPTTFTQYGGTLFTLNYRLSDGNRGGGGAGRSGEGSAAEKDLRCALEADRLGKGAGTVAAVTVAGAQAGPVGALAGLGIGVGVVLAQEILPEKFGPLADSVGAAASEGVYGLLSSQYDRAVKSIFSNAPGVAQIGGSAIGSVALHVMRGGALNGAVGAARWGAAAGLGYLGGYLATYQIAYNTCQKGG